MPVFTNYYEWFYKGGKKVVPNDLTLNGLSLAVWFMDDGSRSRNAWYLNTQQFSVVEQQSLAKTLDDCFGIESTLNRDKSYYRIRIRCSSGTLLREAIEPCLLACFRYKLTDDPVTTDPKGESSLREVS